MEITYDVRDLFFDRERIRVRLDAQKRKRLSKAGAYVRRTARTLLRRQTPRPAPQPPATHSPEPNLRTVLFAYDPHAETVVAGPVRLRKRLKKSTQPTVPALLEHGGSSEVTEYAEEHTLQWKPAAQFFPRTSRRKFAVRRRMAVYEPRPFMGPALSHNQDQFPELFRNCIGP